MSQQVILVTGGSSGIGRAAALRLAAEGHTVYYTYRNHQNMEETQSEAAAANVTLTPILCDLTDTLASAQMVQEICAQTGRIDTLVNCAGISNTKTIEEIDETEWDTMMNVNLRATFFLTKAVYLKMKEQHQGRIITLTSIAGQRGGYFSGIHYCASKGALESMMKCFALNGAAHGILSNAISPGVVETPMTKEEGVTADGIPLGRAASPEELASVIAYLAQDTYINGATIDVNGGQLMR